MHYLSDDELERINGQLDENLDQQPLLLMSLESALHSLFLYVEALPKNERRTQNMDLFRAVRTCVFWIYEYCNAASANLEIDFCKASQLLESAMNYNRIWDFMSGSFDKKRMPRLYQVENVSGIITFSAIDATKHAKAITENLCHDKYDFDFDEVQERCNAFLHGRLDALIAEATPQCVSNDFFRMNEPIIFCRSFSSFLHETFNHAWSLDPCWDLGGYTLADFRSTIEAIQSEAKARRRIHSWMRQHAPDCSFDLSLLPIANKNSIVHNLKEIAQIDAAKLEKIVDDLTLRKGHSFKLDDIPHMPFFELSNGQLYWSLYFTERMYPEVTIWRILNVIRKKSIDQHKKAKEIVQINKIEQDLITQAQFKAEHIKKNIIVPKSEIDMLLIDERDSFGLLVQLKWIAPPIAVKNYHLDFDELTKGLDQADKCLDWLRNNPKDAAKRLSLPESLLSSLEYEAVIVGRHSMGKSRLEFSSHPIINEIIFRWYLLQKQVSLRTFWNSVKQNLYFAENYSLQDTEQGEFNGIKFVGKDLAVLEYPEYTPDHVRVWSK